VESRAVIEVQPLRDMTPLPGTPAFVRGIVNLRGRVLAVYDLKSYFDLPDHGITDLHRIVVVAGRDFELGLLADVVVGVRRLARADIAPPPLSAIAAEYLLGVGEGRLVVLDLERILADPRILVDDGDNE
jgi:purine-binding chemotaxis protein CheW